MRSSDHVVGVSRFVIDAACARLPELADRSTAILNALPWPDVESRPLPWDLPLLLWAGRCVPEKGADVALDAFASVRRLRPDVRMRFAGDGPELEPLRARADMLGLDEAVDFAGWVEPDRVPGLMNEATIVLVSSRWHEPFGLVALEAAQMSRPVIASRVGGLPEVVAEGETGLLVPRDDPAALAEAIEVLLSDRALAVSLGAAGRERARRDFGLKRMIDDYERLYRDLEREAVR